MGKKKATCDIPIDSLIDHMSEMITSALNDLRIELMHQFETKFNDLQQSLNDKFTQKIEDLEQRMTNVEKSIDDRKAKDSENESLIHKLKSDLESALVMANHNEQYSRRWLVRLYNLPEESNENCPDKFIQFVNTKLNLSPPLTNSDIEAAHRVKQRVRDGKPRPMIVRFARRDRRFDVLKKRSCLKQTGFSINEDITRRNLQLLNRLKNNDTISSAWFSNGTVKARHAVSDMVKVVDLFDSVESLFGHVRT